VGSNLRSTPVRSLPPQSPPPGRWEKWGVAAPGRWTTSSTFHHCRREEWTLLSREGRSIAITRLSSSGVQCWPGVLTPGRSPCAPATLMTNNDGGFGDMPRGETDHSPTSPEGENSRRRPPPGTDHDGGIRYLGRKGGPNPAVRLLPCCGSRDKRKVIVRHGSLGHYEAEVEGRSRGA
jgi:hypothetical protein